MTTPIDGLCDDAFSAVRGEFARNFAERGEVGAAVCVIVDGRIVVDLVGGWADREAPAPVATGDAGRLLLGGQGLRRLARVATRRCRHHRARRSGCVGLAGVRRRRQGCGHGAPCAVPSCRGAGYTRTADERRPVELGPHDRRPCGDRAVVRTGNAAHVSHQHLRTPGGRDRAPIDRRDAGAPPPSDR